MGVQAKCWIKEEHGIDCYLKVVLDDWGSWCQRIVTGGTGKVSSGQIIKCLVYPVKEFRSYHDCNKDPFKRVCPRGH